MQEPPPQPKEQSAVGMGTGALGMGAGPPSVPQTPLLTQGALPAARGQHPAGTTSAAGALEADVGPHAAPVGHQSLRPPCPEPLAWSKGPRNAGTGGQSERSGCAHVPGSRARHGSEKGRIKWDREGATFPAIPDIPARGDGRSVPRLDRDTGSKTGMWGKGQRCGEVSCSPGPGKRQGIAGCQPLRLGPLWPSPPAAGGRDSRSSARCPSQV